MLTTLGDLVEDIVVRHDGPINVASDTSAHITRRRGGSAANVAATAARLGERSRLLGQVGTDAIGRALLDELDVEGVDTSHMRRSGTTGTIVALVDRTGERTMLSDRRTCLDLDHPDTIWLDGATVLHVPFYSLVEQPVAETARTVISWAHDAAIPVSIDVSSTAIIEGFGVPAAFALIAELHPAVLFANRSEAELLGLDSALGDSLTVVKRGPDPAIVLEAGREPIEVPAVAVDTVTDTTGAGDAFAAGFLTFGAGAWRTDPTGACAMGHRAAADLLSTRCR